MTDFWQEDVTALIQHTRIAFLATSGKLAAEASMAPYALFEGDILLHLSALAKHTGNIQRSPRMGLMICTPETASASPLALPRLNFQGSINPVSSEDFNIAKAAYLQQIGDAEPLFSFADFTLYRFSIESIAWVGGFGNARKISLDAWRSLTC